MAFMTRFLSFLAILLLGIAGGVSAAPLDNKDGFWSDWSEATFERARDVFSERQLVDLVAVFGAYRMVAGLLALADVAPRAAVEPPLKPR